ncbi:MAG TPA: hypothetical protein VLH08_03630 [Acidobacteriota bacterium]|nr:hypothetical protein [Acidobacteriota bacterium]
MMLLCALKKITVLVSLAILCLVAVPTKAQADWNYSAVVYLWGAGMDGETGTTGANERIVEVDQSFGDILSNLELGFMGGVLARSETWSVSGDFIYMGLGAGVTGPLGNPIDVDVDQTVFGADVGYAVSETADLLAGARIVSLQTKLDFSAPINLEVEAEKTWVDPYVGIRFHPWINENWSVIIRFDIGGFDIGSDIVWNLNANAVWHVTERSSFAFGYRIMDVKYDDEEGDTEFIYDMTNHGPIGGFIYQF